MTPARGQIRNGWYHGWNIVGVCILAQVAANGMPINAFSLFLGDWSATLHTAKSNLLLGIAGCGIVSSLLSPVAGMLADKYPARWLLGSGVFGMMLFCLAMGSVTELWQYLALYAVLLPIALLLATSVPANAVISRWFVRRLGLALGLSGFGLCIAGVIMPPVIAALLPTLGWRAIWQIAGGVIGLVILPLVLITVRDRPGLADGSHYLTPDGAAAPILAHGAHGTRDSSLTWRTILGRRNFWLAVVCYLPMLALYGGCMQNAVPLAVEHRLNPGSASLLISLLNLGQLIATFLGGALSDRFGSKTSLAGIAFATAAGGALVALGHGVWMVAFGMTLAGAGGGFWPALAAAFSTEFGAGGLGRAFGAASFFLPFGVLAPTLVAKSQESIGSYTPGLLVLVAVTILGGLAALLIHERRAGLAPAGGLVRAG